VQQIGTHPLAISRLPVAERRALQASVILAAAVPVAAGLAGVCYGPGAVELSGFTPSQDSQARYLSGLLLGIGFAFWSTVPGIERRSVRFRLLAAIVVLGGLARLFSFVLVGSPSALMLTALALELVATPLLALWQARLAAQAYPVAPLQNDVTILQSPPLRAAHSHMARSGACASVP
jgi:hypothetical protein